MRTVLLVAALVLSGPTCSAARQSPGRSSAEAPGLWEAWPRVRISPLDPWQLKHTDLRKALDDLQIRHPGLFSITEEGVSAEGRRIPLLRIGAGPTGILLWSQMHGDEPTATAALLDLLNWLGLHHADPAAQRLLSSLTLWIIPMLNPDGTERTQRRNAQEIDLNRDALRLASPEGRFLKAVRDRLKPVIGFNLHNQNPDLLAGRGGRQVALALLSVPGDEAHSQTPGIRRTRQLAVKVQELASAFAAGRVSRYDSDYMERAFGDSMTRWGTATLLVETGGWAAPDESDRLVRLNFVVLLGALSALADGTIEAVHPEDYERIPLNRREALSTLVVRNARLAGGRGLPPFPADLAFTVPGPFTGDALRLREPAVLEVGDLSHAAGLSELDATGMLAVPWPGPAGDWPLLQDSLRAQGLELVDEAGLIAAVRAFGESAVAKPGFTGAVLLYRPEGAAKLRLVGAVIKGRLAGNPGTPGPAAAGPPAIDGGRATR